MTPSTSSTILNSKRVLQLNSTVIAGFAGAKSSSFPMQALGLDVDCIYSTQHSNHSGYAHVSKSDVPRHVLADLFNGLVTNNLLEGRYDAFLTGFVADTLVLKDLVGWYKQIKAVNPEAKWICDTVIGDRDNATGKEVYYCPKELVPLFREHVLPLAYVITPNQLECELLSEKSISTRQDAIEALSILHRRGVAVVVLTSVNTEHGSEMLVSTTTTTTATVVEGNNGSSTSEQNIEQCVFQASFQESPHHFTGTGDCMMGLLVGNMLRSLPDKDNTSNVALASSRALSSMQAIVQRTVDSIPASSADTKGIELKIIQSLTDIIQPPETHSFVRIQ